MAEALLLGLTVSLGSAFAVLGALMVFTGVSRHNTPPIFSPDMEDQDAVFVFRDHTLVDCSDRGRQLLRVIGRVQDAEQPGEQASSELDTLLAHLGRHFADLRGQLAQLAEKGDVQLVAHDDSGLALTARWRCGLAHLRLTDTSADGVLVAMDRLSYKALHQELHNLRDVTRSAPLLIWQSDAQGQIIWANCAYITALHDSGQIRDQTLTWPLPPLFADQDLTGRLGLQFSDGPRWYSYQCVAAGAVTLHFATPIDATVQSEFARREMMQMLTRAFATLPIGLAVFDADRRLQVFNPALVDLTGLDPFFLAARPDLGQMLHTLRELRMLPEPRDFGTWRDEIMKLEQAAASGSFNEEWHLETGRIYHVTASPQPGGALAVFMQDITSEASLMRGYKAEIETAQNILDVLPDAIAAFNLAGQAVFANAGYVQLWGRDPCSDMADFGIEQALRDWALRCEATPFWAQLGTFLADPASALELTGTGTLRSGAPIALRAQKLVGGGVVVTFRHLRQDRGQSRSGLETHQDLIFRLDHAAPALPGRDARMGDVAAPVAERGKFRSVKHKGSRIRV
ncbi:PAS domain-containing protein [Roseinatronobacter sp. NSM]|uniref:PAS domain-containing protein n=1 Tax=Roseinatronobacter sp. NSM TaxID=3457785 RepID=UPI00403644AA